MRRDSWTRLFSVFVLRREQSTWQGNVQMILAESHTAFISRDVYCAAVAITHSPFHLKDSHAHLHRAASPLSGDHGLIREASPNRKRQVNGYADVMKGDMGRCFPRETRESLKHKWSQNRPGALDKYKGRLEDGSLEQQICFSSNCIQWQTFVLCILTRRLQKGTKIEILWSASRHMLCQRLLKKK